MALAEVMGSRREGGDGKRKWGEKLSVTSSASDLWNHQSVVFFTGKTNLADSGDTGRRLVEESVDTEVFPGLMFVRQQFQALVAYA